MRKIKEVESVCLTISYINKPFVCFVWFDLPTFSLITFKVHYIRLVHLFLLLLLLLLPSHKLGGAIMGAETPDSPLWTPDSGKDDSFFFFFFIRSFY